MSIHTLCLNILLILFTISPVLLVGIIMNFPILDQKKLGEVFFAKALVCLFIIEILFIGIMNHSVLFINTNINYYWYPISIIIIPVIIALEILVSIAIIKIKGKKIKKISFWGAKNNINNKMIIYSLLIALGEEVIFRKVWFDILGSQFEINICIVLLVTSIVYGFNHLFMGNKIIIQKTISGIIYGMLYILSGSIIIPIITHCLQNLIVLKRGEKS